MHFGATLRLLRVQAGFSLRGLADRVGVSNAYLSRVENGHDAPPTPDRLAAIAAAFGLPAASLLELADRLGPVAADYLERVPAARALVMDLEQRELGPLDIARVRAFIQREFPLPSAARGAARRRIEQLFDPARVILDLVCTDVDDVIDVAAARLAEPTRRSSRDLVRAIKTHERACSSAVGGGLALPHAVVDDVRPAAVAVAVRRPLEAESPDGEPLRLFFVHVHHGGAEYREVLVEMARFATADTVDRLCRASAPDDLVAGLLAHGFG